MLLSLISLPSKMSGPLFHPRRRSCTENPRLQFENYSIWEHRKAGRSNDFDFDCLNDLQFRCKALQFVGNGEACLVPIASISCTVRMREDNRNIYHISHMNGYLVSFCELSTNRITKYEAVSWWPWLISFQIRKILKKRSEISEWFILWAYDCENSGLLGFLNSMQRIFSRFWRSKDNGKIKIRLSNSLSGCQKSNESSQIWLSSVLFSDHKFGSKIQAASAMENRSVGRWLI
jgi:hypothetical protein